MTPRSGRRAARALAALVLALASVLGLAIPAGAHAQLVGSNPSDGTTVQASPRQLRIDLTQSVFGDKTSLSITDSRGRAIPVTTLAVVATGAGPDQPTLVPRAGSSGVPTTILAGIPTLEPEIYRVTWKTLSTDDLHATSGVFVFGVQRSVGHQAGQVSDPLPPWGEVLSRTLLVLGAAVAVGTAAVLALLARHPVPGAVRRRLLGTGAAAAAVGALAGIALLLVQADAFTAGPRFVADVLASPAFALRWALREGSAVLAAVLLLLTRRRIPAHAAASPVTPGEAAGLAGGGLVLGAGFAAAAALLSHSGQTDRALDGLVHAVHVAAALTWVGTLLAATVLVVPGRAREDLAASAALRRVVLSRFGLVGLGCVTLLLASGLVLTGSGSASLDAFLLSTYGRLVLLKTVALLAALVTAVSLTLALHPGLLPARWRDGRLSRQRPGLVVAECLVLLAGLVLGATAAGARPALGTEWVPTSIAPPILSDEPDSLVETVKVGPDRPGRNFVSANVFETRRPAPGPVTAVDLVVARPGRPGTTAAMNGQGDGVWLAATDAFDEPGNWTVAVVVHRAGLPDARSDYTWFVPDPSARLARPLVSSSGWGSALDAAALGVALGGATAAGLVLSLRRRRIDAAAAGRATGTGEQITPQQGSGTDDRAAERRLRTPAK